MIRRHVLSTTGGLWALAAFAAGGCAAGGTGSGAAGAPTPGIKAGVKVTIVNSAGGAVQEIFVRS